MPKIEARDLGKLYEGVAQYNIPPYQRTITWPENQWVALFNDVIALSHDEKKNHLFQIFQIKNMQTNSKVEVGDGQQRLVQTSLILAALGYKIDAICCDNSVPDEARIELSAIQKRIIPFKEDGHTVGLISYTQDGHLKPRIHVALNNRLIYQTIILWSKTNKTEYTNFRDDNIVISAFKFYLNAISNQLAEKTIEEKIEKINAILHAVTKQLIFAVAYFNYDEDMQASFEATNSRGFPLTNSELIKNHIFQEFEISKQEMLVQTFWKKYDDSEYWIHKPIFKSSDLTRAKKTPEKDNLDLLFMYELMSRDSYEERDFTKYSIFENFKYYHVKALKGMTDVQKQDYYKKYLQELDRFSELYEKFLYRSDQTNPSLKKEEIKSKGHSFTPEENRYWQFYQRIGIGCKDKDGAIILLFALLRMNDNHKDICDLMDIIESYYIRKVIVFQHYKKSFDILLPLVSKKTTASKLKNSLLLQTDSAARWESDEAVQEALKTKVYKNHNRLFTLLNIDFENTQKNVKREYSQKIEYLNQSLEHFMPQNPANDGAGWPVNDLPEGITREDITYNFGNFLLLPTTVNTEVGNMSHSDKVKHFKKDANELGIVGIVSVDKVLGIRYWGYEAIIAESQKKALKILAKYIGPVKNIAPSQVKTELVKGNIKPGQRVFVDLVNGQTKQVGIVKEEGYIEMIDRSRCESLSELKKNTFKEVNDKQKTIRYEF